MSGKLINSDTSFIFIIKYTNLEKNAQNVRIISTVYYSGMEVWKGMGV